MNTKAKLITELIQFQAEMTAKVLAKYDQGYEWWDDPTELSNEALLESAHGNDDPLDRANFNFFLWYRHKAK